MSPERTSLKQIVKKIGEKVDYVLQGRSPEEDARIIRILNNPSGISEKDIASWIGERLDDAFYSHNTTAIAFIATKRINSLPPDELKKRVLEDAAFKAKKWRLISNT